MFHAKKHKEQRRKEEKPGSLSVFTPYASLRETKTPIKCDAHNTYSFLKRNDRIRFPFLGHEFNSITNWYVDVNQFCLGIFFIRDLPIIIDGFTALISCLPVGYFRHPYGSQRTDPTHTTKVRNYFCLLQRSIIPINRHREIAPGFNSPDTSIFPGLRQCR